MRIEPHKNGRLVATFEGEAEPRAVPMRIGPHERLVDISPDGEFMWIEHTVTTPEWLVRLKWNVMYYYAPKGDVTKRTQVIRRVWAGGRQDLIEIRVNFDRHLGGFMRCPCENGPSPARSPVAEPGARG